MATTAVLKPFKYSVILTKAQGRIQALKTVKVDKLSRTMSWQISTGAATTRRIYDAGTHSVCSDKHLFNNRTARPAHKFSLCTTNILLQTPCEISHLNLLQRESVVSSSPGLLQVKRAIWPFKRSNCRRPRVVPVLWSVTKTLERQKRF